MSCDISNVVSIDVEQWFHRQVLQPYIDKENQDASHLLPGMEKILKLFRDEGKRTTFFVLGEVARTLPEVVEWIVDDGHEVGYHGWSHKTLNELDEDSFRYEVEKGCKVLRHITGDDVKGFRSPMFSLSEKSSYALSILTENGFTYDSSILPAITLKHSSWRAPYRPYYPNFDYPWIESEENTDIKEFPVLSRKVGLVRIPSGGGFYSRVLSSEFVLQSLRKINEAGHPGMLYFHPWEVDGFPSIEMPFLKRVFAYYNVPSFDILKKIVKSMKVCPALEVLEEHNW